MLELRQKTHAKVERLRESGYEVVEMWECDFLRMLEENPELTEFFKKHQPYFPIDPRDSFFGGRTNAILLWLMHPNIRYVDFTR